MEWIQLSLQTDQNKIDFVSEVLTGLGCLSLSYIDAYDEPIYEPPVGKTPLWRNVVVNALFTPNINKNYVESLLKELCDIETLEYKTIKEQIWEKEYQKDYQTMKFGKKLWVCPSWKSKINPPDGAVVINMEPGLAFGTGTHQTTQLCLEYLSNNPPKDMQVIDFGSGTGILAIAAAKLGAKSVLAIDNDPQAMIATKKNIKNNNCTSMVSTKSSINTSHNKEYDLIVANILASPLIELAPIFIKLLKINGSLILSGILKDQCEKILNCYMKKIY